MTTIDDSSTAPPAPEREMPGDRLSFITKLAYGGGDFASQLVWSLGSSFLTLFYTDNVGLSAGVAGMVLAVARIFDALLAPVMTMVPHGPQLGEPALPQGTHTRINAEDRPRLDKRGAVHKPPLLISGAFGDQGLVSHTPPTGYAHIYVEPVGLPAHCVGQVDRTIVRAPQLVQRYRRIIGLNVAEPYTGCRRLHHDLPPSSFT